MPSIDVVAVDRRRGVVTIRTDMGFEAAKKLAAFELEREVYISVIFDVPASRVEIIKEVARAKKKREKPRLPALQSEYVFTSTCGKRVALPDVDHALNLRALEAGGARGVLVGDPTQNPRRTLKPLREYLLDQLRTEIAEEQAIEMELERSELSEAERDGNVTALEPDAMNVG